VRYINRFTSETKFLVKAAIGDDLRAWARERLGPDPHGTGPFQDQYGVTSIYFDTDAHDVYQRHGSYGRSKYRIRHYESDKSAFLERKLRTKLFLSKRRTRIPLEAVPTLRLDSPDPAHPGFWFFRRIVVRHLHPVCQIRYSRTARMAETPEGHVRMTLDAGISAMPTRVAAFSPSQGKMLAEGLMVLELKYAGVFPHIFKDMVDRFGLRPHPASKYRLAVHTLNLAAPHVSAMRT
jgi:VTC domain